MGGLVGHLSHIYENRQLTFSDIVNILTNVSEGRLEAATEKLDGINIVFTHAYSGLRIARNNKDIATGGMSIEDVSARFEGRGSIKNAFVQAYKVLDQAISTLTKQQRLLIFGTGAKQRWYSAEIVYPAGINTINYDCNAIVFHGYPVFEIEQSSVKRLLTAAGIEVLKSSIDQMQKAVELRGWRLVGPTMIKLQELVDKKPLYDAIDAIDNELCHVNLGYDASIQQFLEAKCMIRCKMIGVSDYVAKQMTKRLLNQPEALNVIQLIKLAPGFATDIKDLVSNDKDLIAVFLSPIETAINSFACEILSRVNSVLISDGQGEVNRLRSELTNAIDAIKKEDDWSKIVQLEKQLMKFEKMTNSTSVTSGVRSSVEGIVFIYKGNTYKLTGTFAPMHQIISLWKKF